VRRSQVAVEKREQGRDLVPNLSIAAQLICVDSASSTKAWS
jgi:hypothetical protein